MGIIAGRMEPLTRDRNPDDIDVNSADVSRNL